MNWQRIVSSKQILHFLSSFLGEVSKKVVLHLKAYNKHLSSVPINIDFSGAWAGNIVYDLNPLSISVRSRHNNCQYKIVKDTKRLGKQGKGYIPMRWPQLRLLLLLSGWSADGYW